MTDADEADTLAGHVTGFLRKHPVGWCMVVFFLGVLPVLQSVYTYHGDERLYTDSAILMRQSGDYLTPLYPDGSLRFNKPIITYWSVLAGYKLFGVNLFASRFFSLIAGCLVLALTFRIARVLFGRREEATFATLILFSNIQLFYASIRATPDAFLCLFLSLSLYGFVRIIFGGERTSGAYLCAYLGAGLAVEAKGMSGFLPVVLAFLFCAFRRQAGTRPRDLVHVPAMAAGLAVALAWYAAAYALHGNALFRGFWEDQVTSNLPNARRETLANLLDYTVGMLRPFLPWSLILALAAFLFPRRLKEVVVQNRAAFLFALIWYLLLLGVFAPANFRRIRFFLPAFVVLSGLLGALLARLVRDGDSRRLLTRLLAVVGAAAVLGGFALLWAGMAIDWRVQVGGAAFCLLGFWAWVAARSDGPEHGVRAMALIAFFVIAIIHAAIVPVFNSTPVPDLAARIAELSAERADVLMLGMPTRSAGQLTMLLGPNARIREIPESAMVAAPPPEAAFLVFPARLREKVNLRGYRVERCGFAYRSVKPRDVRAILRAPDKTAAIAGLRVRYDLAVRSGR